LWKETTNGVRYIRNFTTDLSASEESYLGTVEGGFEGLLYIVNEKFTEAEGSVV
jgi:hypothetical protein